MKRSGLLSIISTVLVLAGASASLAVFPVPDGSVLLQLNQGWYSGTPAWFISTDATDISIAGNQRLTLFQAVPTGAAPVYIVTNVVERPGPVFSTAPDPVAAAYALPAYYSGLWRVVYVTWSSGAARVPLTSEQQILDLASRGAVSMLGTAIAVDYSIVALGPLGKPEYLIPQAQDLRLATREIQLPTWSTFGHDPMNGQVFVKRMIIPDALSLGGNVPGHIDVAALLGSNPAYGLAFMGPVDNHNVIAAINWVQFTGNGGTLPVHPDQLLVSREAPTACGPANWNSGYSPFSTMIVMVRFPFVSPDYVFSDWWQISNSPGLSGVFAGTVNAPVLCN